jgi:Helix-turn-helix domain
MTPRFAKVSEIADRFRVSADAVYLWIRQGKIPSDCVIRIAGTVRIDEEQFEQRLRSGALCQPRGRKSPIPESKPQVSVIADDSFTTVAKGGGREHKWTGETGSVQAEHPFSPGMISSER